MDAYLPPEVLVLGGIPIAILLALLIQKIKEATAPLGWPDYAYWWLAAGLGIAVRLVVVISTRPLPQTPQDWLIAVAQGIMLGALASYSYNGAKAHGFYVAGATELRASSTGH